MTQLLLPNALVILTHYLLSMSTVTGVNKLFSIKAVKRFGRPREFGTSQLGFLWFGAEDWYINLSEYGNQTYGVSEYANIVCLSGQYRKTWWDGKSYITRDMFAVPKDPGDPVVLANRQKFKDGTIAWSVLTLAEKLVYNNNAIKLRLYGYNLFMREYLLSH